MRWYILQAYSGFEQRVAQALIERIKINNMEEYFGEVLVPKEKVKDVKDGKQRESERKFFPGYVMVEMKMTSDSWQLVKHTERVLGFIGGTPERPMPITKAEADRILNRLKETSEAPRPKNLFEVGEKVRATEGTFKDFSGTVEKVDYEKNRLTVSINIFGRATPVELELGQVEKDID
ncbi:transcription termination/antitermination protein NusG [Anaerobiospirillum succiniciproducens]|uniref:transcription termination/antitermination protein NusG n=1 Tax=Anaerobiospirillum succiniciproducens TaxID=13335 RepID=UPI0004806890|nr:transcription termination/antitermination protein NusG [Anaerobiospirillum succiniciproducens]MDO4675627.1 transcription termination/antitermination protein NusG [Anaerobiospirillum succiniciproducens]